jgi:pyruvate formate lyase activating enzyme
MKYYSQICAIFFLACVETCPSGALSQIGQPMTVDSILHAVLQDQSFFNNSGGGVTLSGGEPTMFADFTSDLLRALKRSGVPTRVETRARV